MLPDSEPTWPIPSRSPHTYRHAKAPRKGKIAAQKPTVMSWEALLAAGVARLMEELNVAVDISSRTFHYLQSAREFQRQVQDDPKSRAYIMQLHHKMSKLAGSASQHPRAGITGTREEEIRVIAVQAGLLYEDVPDLALYLEGTVRQMEVYGLATSEFFLIYTTLHPWGRLLVSFWPEKLTFGCAWIFGTCVLNAGTGCRPAINWTVILSLAGPICALVHMAFLARKR